MSHTLTVRSHSFVLWLTPLLVVAGGLVLQSCTSDAPSTSEASETKTPHLVAPSDVAAGRYFVTVAGCNDCHTKGYLAKQGDVPEENRLTGNPIGWRGPWGTTYATNLRLYVDTLSADEFVKTLHTRTQLPPMPWMNVNEISERDARAIYAYLKHLGPKGTPTPENVPPGTEPKTPYVRMAPPQKPAASSPPSGE